MTIKNILTRLYLDAKIEGLKQAREIYNAPNLITEDKLNEEIIDKYLLEFKKLIGDTYDK